MRWSESLIHEMSLLEYNQAELIQKVFEMRKSYENEHSLPYVKLVQFCEAEIFRRKIIRSPLDKRAKRWQAKRIEFLEYFYSRENLEKDQQDFETIIKNALDDRLSSYLSSHSIQPNPRRTGEIFLAWLNEKDIDLNVFSNEIISFFAKRSSATKFTMDSEIATQIYFFMEWHSKGLEFKKRLERYEAFKLLKLRSGFRPNFKASPVPVLIGTNFYVLEDFVESGSYGVTFEGTPLNHPERRLIFKMLRGQDDDAAISNDLLSALNLSPVHSTENSILIFERAEGTTVVSTE